MIVGILVVVGLVSFAVSPILTVIFLFAAWGISHL